MKDLIIYQFEVACCLALFYLFYWLILRKEANFHFKRLFFICAGIMAFVLPALHIQLSISAEEIPVEYITILPSQLISYVPVVAQPEKTDPWFWISLFWATGSTYMLIRILFSFLNIGKILKETTVSPEGQAFKITNGKVQSFSFFKIIVINAHHYQSKAMKYILAHEQAHSDHYHSLDVLLMELMKTIQWFNPFAWLFGKESLQNLEYLADQKVAHTLYNTQDYQLAIIQHSRNATNKLLRSEFSKSNLKKRIIMMNQQKSTKIGMVKLLLLLPLIGILFLSFSLKIENLDIRKEVTDILPQIVTDATDDMELNTPPSIDSTPSEAIYTIIANTEQMDSTQEFIEEVILNDHPNTSDNSVNKVYSIVEDQPIPPTGSIVSYYEVINKELNYPEDAKNNGIKGKVFVQFIVQKDGKLREVVAVKGLGYGCDEEAVRIVANGPKWTPGEQNGTKVDVRMILPVTFGGTTKSTSDEDSTDTPIKEVFTIVEDQPTPTTEDMDSYYQVIKSNLIYPEDAINNEIKGRVFVQFIVQKDGTLREVKVVKGLGYGCDEEAVRVIKNGPKWNVGKQRGRAVDVRMILPVPFGVPLKKKQNSETRTLNGVVLHKGGWAIPGASVSVVGTQEGTFTDPNGKFEMNVKTRPWDKLELVVAARGFSTEIIKITKEDYYKIILTNRHIHVLPTTYEPLSDSLSTDDENPMVILDGKEITYEQMKKMETNPDGGINQISILKGATAVSKYGQKAKNGAIIITTKE